MARRRPSVVLAVRAEVDAASPPPAAGPTLEEALRASGAASSRPSDVGWLVEVDWRTLVLGVIRRDVDERLLVRVDDGVVTLRCRSDGTHGAHAAAAAAVIAVAATTWLLTRQLLPAATTLVGGLLLVDVTRELALTALERRLARLAADLTAALWPGRPARVEVARIPASGDD